MRNNKIAGICLCLAISAFIPGMTATAAPAGGVSPVKVWGNLQNRTEDTWTIENQNPGGYVGEFVVHISKDTKVLDAKTGMPVSEDMIEAGSLVYAYIGAAVTASIPPQAGAELCLTNIPDEGSIPDYVEVREIEKKAGGYQLTVSDGSGYWIPQTCAIFPYLTRNMLYLEDIYAGAKCLIWLDKNDNGEKIMMFAPYAAENTVQTGWQLESGMAGTPYAVWIYYNEDGSKHYGWLEDAGKWYYLNKETGVMERGFIQIDDKTYYLLEDGSLMMESRIFTPDQNGVLQS